MAQAADREINVILPLTGGGAFLGKAEQQALMQFEKAANTDGGIHGQPLKFVFHDDQSSPQVAVQLANQVKASNPPVILGSALVALCNAMAPLMKDGPLLYCFSPGIHPVNGGFVYSSSISTKELAGRAAAVFRPQGLEEGRADHLDRCERAGRLQEFQDRWSASDGHKDVELVAEAQLNPTDVSAAAQIQRLKGANPDVLVAWSTGGPIGTVFKAIHDAGIELPVATTNGNQTYAQMAQYAAFLPKELYIPAADFLKSAQACAGQRGVSGEGRLLQGVRRHRHQAGRSLDLCLGSGAPRRRARCAN